MAKGKRFHWFLHGAAILLLLLIGIRLFGSSQANRVFMQEGETLLLQIQQSQQSLQDLLREAKDQGVTASKARMAACHCSSLLRALETLHRYSAQLCTLNAESEQQQQAVIKLYTDLTFYLEVLSRRLAGDALHTTASDRLKLEFIFDTSAAALEALQSCTLPTEHSPRTFGAGIAAYFAAYHTALCQYIQQKYHSYDAFRAAQLLRPGNGSILDRLFD